ncbi:MAG TPA: 3-hydroxyacyl-CoA dehydrogenase family protein [Elusimicrobiales bacterium]|nr:3-hydroxyacyl-CoA dehydrogenase family protein [Elusimicrobiales bacterium]
MPRYLTLPRHLLRAAAAGLCLSAALAAPSSAETEIYIGVNGAPETPRAPLALAQFLPEDPSRPQDIELAMTKGVNYPRGLLAWGDALGAGQVLATLEALQAEYGEDRYRPSPLLRRTAKSNGRLLT